MLSLVLIFNLALFPENDYFSLIVLGFVDESSFDFNMSLDVFKMNLFGDHWETWRRAAIFVLQNFSRVAKQIRLGLLVLDLWLCIDWIYIWIIIQQAKFLKFYLSVDGEDSILLKRLFIVIFGWLILYNDSLSACVVIVEICIEVEIPCLMNRELAEWML
jgi:hypothetical protein